MEPLVIVGDSKFGRGLFAACDIPAGATIFEFSGPLLTGAEDEALGDAACYPIQIGPDRYLDPFPPGRFINHSCEPNTAIRGTRQLIALTNIREGEELCFDYSTTMSERRWTMLCGCGAASCRGIVGDFHDLPLSLQERYLAMQIVQPFIVEESERLRLQVKNA